MVDDNPWLARRVLGFAHRGGALEHPENTLYAFRAGLAAGTTGLELDVHATADGELVVCHDRTVDRTTDGTGEIAALSLAEVRSLDAAAHFVPGIGTLPEAEPADWSLAGVAHGAKTVDDLDPEELRIPTLREVLATFPDVVLNMEIKDGPPRVPAYTDTLASLLTEFGRADDVIVAGFEDTYLAEFRRRASGIHTGMGSREVAAFRRSGEPPVPGPRGARPVVLQLPPTYGDRPLVTQELVAGAHTAGYAVHVWTIDDPDLMAHLVELGVDGIMSDRPSVLADTLDRLGVAWAGLRAAER